MLKSNATQVLGGILDEAKMLLDLGIEPSTSMPSRAIGYRQCMQWLLTVQERRKVSDADILEVAKQIQGASRRLLKGQLSFHRDLELFQWVDMRQGMESAVAHIASEVSKATHVGASLPPC